MNKTKNKPAVDNGKKGITISFYKKRTCWYAEVPQHTEGQNLMVDGADDLCERMSQGHKRVTIKAVGYEAGENTPNAILSLEKIAQSPYGATYRIDGDAPGIPEECWLCNVTKTVFGGNHPRYIDILTITPNDDLPYNGHLPWAA